MKIYIMNITPLLNEQSFSEFYKKCPQRRRDKIDSKKLMQDKALSLGCELLTKRGFCDFGKKSFEIIYSKSGKPFDKDGNVHFSLSHSGKFSVAAFSDVAIGIDVEQRRNISEKLPARYFATDELSVAQNNEARLKLWTRKEALAKAFDIPLSAALAQNVVYDTGILNSQKYFLQTYTDDDFIISVCSLGPEKDIEIICHVL